MALDITTLTGQGIQPYYPQWVNHGISQTTGLRYESKYECHVVNFSSEGVNNLHARFYIKRYLSNGDFDISYFIESIADDTTSVDKFGVKVESDSPNKWGTELDRMRVLVSAGVSDKDVIDFYQNDLFTRGLFDFPKNRNI